jgi:gluconolactonase
MTRFVLTLAGFALLAGCAAEAPVEVAEALPETAKTVAQVTFTEGPTSDEAGNVYFSEMRTNRIMKWSPGEGVSTFRVMEQTVNGLKFDPRGRLLAAETSGGRIVHVDGASGPVTALAENSEATPITRPNDLTFDGKGRIYFTDYGGSRIYRIDPEGAVTQILGAPDVEVPNGIVIAPNDKTLYYVESNGKEGGQRCIMAYDLAEDGSVSNGRVFHNFYPGRSADGLAIDSEGNVYAAAGLNRLRGSSETLDTKAGIHVFSPAGERIAFHPIWEDTVTNCGFGGDDLKTLYVTAGKLLLAIETEVPGTRR